MNRYYLALGLLVLTFNPGSALTAEPSYTAKYEKLAAPTALSEPIRKLLTDEALVVHAEKDEVVLKLWFRTEIPAKATSEQITNGLTYREIPEGEIVGAIEFPAPFTDFRKQRIPAGVYTLRFALQPDIGDHTGTAPHPEFCLMCPVSKDKSADPVDVKTLIEMSSEVNEGKHPAVLLLFPNSAKEVTPKVVHKGNGVWITTTRRAVLAGEAKTTLGFGITIAGTTKQ